MRFKVASRVRGLSDEAFREAFGTEEQCRVALLRLRWPDGFLCPSCGHRGHCVLAGRGLYQCNRCKKQTSPTAGTIFHATKLPLTLWFAAIHLIVTAKNGISSVELGRRLGVKQPTAWAVKHKIMAVMARREGETPLTGRVEMDDAYLGGMRSGGKRGRGAAGKTPFVAAVSTSPEGRPRKLKLAPVKGFRKREIARGAKHWLAPGTAVVTDGLGCWSALDEIACSHQAIRTGSGRKAARVASFKWDLQRLVDSVFTLPASFAFSRTAGCPCGSGQRRPPASPGPRSRAGRATGCAASPRNCQLCVGFGERDSFLRLRPAGGAARAPRRHGWPVRVPARSQGGSGRSSSSGGAASTGGGGSSHPPSMR